MSGGAPAVDSSNNLYVLTGNGPFDANSATPPNNDYGDSLLQLTRIARGQSVFHARRIRPTTSNQDMDFGAGGAAVLADLPAGSGVTHALVCGGKDGTLYVLNRDLLGGFGDMLGRAEPSRSGHADLLDRVVYGTALCISHAVGGPLAAYQLNTSTAANFSLVSILRAYL